MRFGACATILALPSLFRFAKVAKNPPQNNKNLNIGNYCTFNAAIFVFSDSIDLQRMLSASQIQELQRRIAVYDDEAAYKELFKSFYKPLRQFAFSFIRNHESSEEIVSDVFIKIWEKRTELESILNLRVYLYIAIKNTALKYLLKEKKQTAISIDELEIELRSFHWTPEELVLTAEMLRKIEEAINELPPRCRIVFKLIREDHLKYKEVAEILNISVKTVDNQLTIALKKISKAINFDLHRLIQNN